MAKRKGNAMDNILSRHSEETLEHTKILVEELITVLEPIADHDREMLALVANRLKGSGGEDWAIGEMVERACALLDAIEESYSIELRDDFGGAKKPSPIPRTEPDTEMRCCNCLVVTLKKDLAKNTDGLCCPACGYAIFPVEEQILEEMIENPVCTDGTPVAGPSALERALDIAYAGSTPEEYARIAEQISRPWKKEDGPCPYCGQPNCPHWTGIGWSKLPNEIVPEDKKATQDPHGANHPVI